MKNKILLLFVLLIPSLCFGKSVNINIIQDSELDVIRVLINSSVKVIQKHEGTDVQRWVTGQIVFQTHKGVIHPETNLQKKQHFRKFFGIFLDEEDTIKRLSKFFDSEVRLIDLGREVKDWMIKNNYALTFKKELHVLENFTSSDFYFYKQD